MTEPPILLHYLATHGFESLQARGLKTALYSEFNDPFDGAYQDRIHDKPSREDAVQEFKSRLDNEQFLLGFMLQHGLKDLAAARTRLRKDSEHRLLVHPEDCVRDIVEQRELHFITFQPEWVRRVDFGLRYKREQMVEEMGPLKPCFGHVHWFRAERHSTSFRLEYLPADSP